MLTPSSTVRAEQQASVSSPLHLQDQLADTPERIRRSREQLYDRQADADDESHVNAAPSRYALICENCLNHNGLVRNMLRNDAQYFGPKCGHLNASAKSDPYPRSQTSPVTIPSYLCLNNGTVSAPLLGTPLLKQHSTSMANSRTGCKGDKEDEAADMNLPMPETHSQIVQPGIRKLPRFDPGSLPSGFTSIFRGIQDTQLPSTEFEVEIAEGDILYQLAFRKVVRLKSGRVVKCGLGLRYEEAATMLYITAHTTIPIPGNPQFVKENGKLYLIMDYVDGKPLSDLWPDLQSDEKKTIFAELRGYVNQLRALQPERSGYIGSLNYGPCLDRRVVGYFHCGPFDTEHQFNDHVAATLRPEVPDERRRFLRNMMKDDHRIVFSHGDLHAGNILIQDGHVVGILDWEMAGWYPEYWEWCKALWVECELEGWSTSLKEFLQPHDYEYTLDRLLLSNSDAWW